MVKSQNLIELDVAVIGGGISGLAAALSLDPRMRVGVFRKRTWHGAASGWAQGGIAGAGASGEQATQLHVADTIAAGGGLCDERIVRHVAEQGQKSISWLESQGVAFTREDSGELHLVREGGHQLRRIAHVRDATGRAIVNALESRLLERGNISVFEHHVAVDLTMDGDRCSGFYTLDVNAGEMRAVSAAGVVLATGGAGKVYLYTTNPDDSTGDGIAMAWRAGCRIANMEFVQFHPTCLFHPHAKSFLISEALRGEGGKLVDSSGRPIMPGTGGNELATRDTVAKAIDAEMKRTGADCVYLDITHLGGEFIREHFPNINERCLALGIDISEQPIPVVPAAHYFCGGISTKDAGATDINGLFAVGEAAHTGLHGANRLASNSLLECVVFAREAAAALNDSVVDARTPIDPWDQSMVMPPEEKIMIAHNWEELRRAMWDYVGIVRSDERLRRAQRRIQLLREEVDSFYGRHIINGDFIELRNLLTCAELVVESAMRRRESRGLHHNIDCPDLFDEATDTVLSKGDLTGGR